MKSGEQIVTAGQTLLNEGDTVRVEGAREVGIAVAASTFTTMAVFLPILFAGGMAQQLFGPMALTQAFALFASLLVSLTLILMLSCRLLRSKHL